MKFIYFDVGNVFHTTEHVFATVAKDFNLKPVDFGNIFKQCVPEVTLGKITATDFWQRCCTELNLNNGQSYNFPRSWVSDYTIIPSMHFFAKEVVEKYKVGILSNHYIGPFSESFSQEKIPKINYSAVISSAEVGFKKPQSEIYDIAEDKCGFSGSDIFFIDDKQENLDEAARHGWQTFLFDYKNPEKSVEELKLITSLRTSESEVKQSLTTCLL